MTQAHPAALGALQAYGDGSPYAHLYVNIATGAPVRAARLTRASFVAVAVWTRGRVLSGLESRSPLLEVTTGAGRVESVRLEDWVARSDRLGLRVYEGPIFPTLYRSPLNCPGREG